MQVQEPTFYEFTEFRREREKDLVSATCLKLPIRRPVIVVVVVVAR